MVHGLAKQIFDSASDVSCGSCTDPDCQCALTILLGLGVAEREATAGAGGAVPGYRFLVGEIGNLVYQLDCLSGGGAPCAFEDLWKQRLGWSAADDEVLAQRKRIKARYKGATTLEDMGDDGPLLADYPQMLVTRRKVQRAALDARDLDDYRRRLELVVLPQDAVELARLTDHFRPRFQRFFREAQPRLLATRRRFEFVLRRPEVRAHLGQAAAFFEVPSPAAQRIDISLMAIPPEWTGRTSGEQFENQAVMDVTVKEDVANQSFLIAMHEGFHYLYGTASTGAGYVARARSSRASPAGS